ncbi:YdhK family protein [Paenibacillus sp. S28]|uniref:YdhK family protein n=1 Tax=Paenibacillus sp. S28 TaxID=2767463 RepID=UPI002D7EDEFF|nr:YdhK family protein [Paenibacillus sp. S28]
MKKVFIFISLAAILVLSACGNKDNANNNTNMDMGSMNHSGSGEVPAGLKEAQNPIYKVGDEVVIHTKHMEGMDGAKAKVVGAYDTVAYAVTYTPTTGGKPVPNHKWIIQEEIKDAGSEPLQPGTKVTIEADHMEGMKGAEGAIDSAEKTTVYMVDYTPTTGGNPVKNHQWVVESELSK